MTITLFVCLIVFNLMGLKVRYLKFNDVQPSEGHGDYF